MIKIDTRIWNDKRRMRERIRNLATVVMSMTAVNGFYMFRQKVWVLLVINIIFFLSGIPIFISWAKFQKEPPKIENEN